jgi:hypothetical protein
MTAAVAAGEELMPAEGLAELTLALREAGAAYTEAENEPRLLKQRRGEWATPSPTRTPRRAG